MADPSDAVKRALADPVMLRLLRNLCPKRGSGLTSVTISGGGKTVELTADTRDRLNARLKEKSRG